MKTIFDNDDEKLFFAKFCAEKLNEQIDKLAEKYPYQHVIGITSGMIIDCINSYEQ